MKNRSLLFLALSLATWAFAVPLHADDVVAVVSAKSPVTTLSPTQVADIFLG
jgi:ABC-type phosphate transport system substrate-binding protein